MATIHNSEITFHIDLDENKIPESISWSAIDGGIENKESKAIMISVWDHKNNDTLRMDLWTKDMPIYDMKKFYHQTLLSMAESYERATNDQKMSDTMRDFCDYFKEKVIEKP